MASGHQSQNTVRVLVRARPLLAAEAARGQTEVVECPDAKTVCVTLPSNVQGQGVVRTFDFGMACGSELHQAAVYEHSGAAQFAEMALEGFPATILAYGSTGSGKTYTMSGLDQRDGGGGAVAPAADAGAHDGIIPRTCQQLWSSMATAERKYGRKHTVLATYCEVYNEQVFDLLNLTGKPLAVRHQPASDEFYVCGALEVQCESLDDVMAVIAEGHLNRRRASHDLNQDSSRSHSLLTLQIMIDDAQVQPNEPASSTAPRKRGKLTFVDLAGSERLKRSRTSSAEETGAINKSLFTLAKVISVLSDMALQHDSADQRQHHVPYRDSTLTKLLADALGGNALALFIACVSPALAQADETTNTLSYALRAQSIRNRPRINITGGDPAGKQSSMESELTFLRQEVLRLRTQAAMVHPLQEEVAILTRQLQECRAANRAADGAAGVGPSGSESGDPIDPLAGGRKRQQPREAVSQKGVVHVGRPPPGIAGRETRTLKDKLRRTETALAASQARETAARRMIEQLKEAGVANEVPAAIIPGSAMELAYGSPPRARSPLSHRNPNQEEYSHSRLPGI